MFWVCSPNCRWKWCCECVRFLCLTHLSLTLSSWTCKRNRSQCWMYPPLTLRDRLLEIPSPQRPSLLMLPLALTLPRSGTLLCYFCLMMWKLICLLSGAHLSHNIQTSATLSDLVTWVQISNIWIFLCTFG